MVLVGLQYLFEIRRTILSPPEIAYKLGTELQTIVCDYSFPVIAETALGETWTRDPLDRLIVAHARANGLAGLVSKDEMIAEHYPNNHLVEASSAVPPHSWTLEKGAWGRNLLT